MGKKKMRAGLIAGMAMAAILAAPVADAADITTLEFDSITGKATVSTGVNTPLNVNGAFTLGSNGKLWLTIDTGGELVMDDTTANRNLTVGSGGTLEFAGGKFTNDDNENTILMRGGTVYITAGSVEGLDVLLDQTAGIDFRTGAGVGGTVNINVISDVDDTAITQTGAVGGTFNIDVAKDITWGKTTAADADFGAAVVNINENGGQGTFKAAALKAGVLNIYGGEVTASGTTTIGTALNINGGTNTFAAVTVTAGNLTISNGTNTFAGAVLAGSNSDGNLLITGGKNTFSGTAAITAGTNNDGSLRFGGGYNYFTTTTGTPKSLIATGDGTIEFYGGSVNTFGSGAAAMSFTLTTSGEPITFSNTEIILLNQATLTAGADLKFNSGSLLQVGPAGIGGLSATLNLGSSNTVDFERATLDLGANTLTVSGSGTAEIFLDNSTLRFRADGTEFGQVTVATIPVEFTGENRVDIYGKVSDVLAAYGSNHLFQTDGALIGASNVYSLLYELEIDSGEIKVKSYKGFAGAFSEAGGPIQSTNFQRAGALMDQIYNSGNNQALSDSLYKAVAMIDDIDKAGREKDAEIALRQLIGESTLGARQAAADTAFKTQGAVLGRLDKIRDTSGSTPPAAGDSGLDNRVWVGGFGSWNKQKDRDNVLGYDYNAGGFALGYDHEAETLPLTLGAVTAFSWGKIESNNSRDKIDVDTFSLGLYGSYRFTNGLFVDGTVGYGHASNESTVNLVTGGQKTGSFSIDSWQFGARTGYIFEAGDFRLTPSVGLRYLYTQQGSWGEYLNEAAVANGGIALWFGSQSDHQVDIPLNLTVNTSIESGNALITPELRLGVNFVAKRPDNELQMGFVGSDASATLKGISPARTTFEGGAGLKIKLNDMVDVFVNYDLQAGSKFMGHNASAGLGFQF